MADRFKDTHDWTPDGSNPQGWPRDRNFMIRPGATPQLVLNDPISEELPDIEERAAFVRRLLDDGWRITGDWGVYCHADKDFVWKVSWGGFRRSVDGWIAFAEWVLKETAAGRGSPYLPRILELTIADSDKWFCAKIERLQEVYDLSDDVERLRVEAEIVEVQRPIGEHDFRDNASELADIRRRLASHFGGVWGFDLVDRNFMVRPGPAPQLVILDPIANRRTPPPDQVEPIDQLMDWINSPSHPPKKSGLADLVKLLGAALVRARVGQK